jgi:hypothetical protein
MHVDGQTARRLMDQCGSELRMVLVDHGKVVGVGTSSRRPPGWVGDVMAAVHDTCSEPGCSTAARICDVDHAITVEDRGGTHVGNLAPLCSRSNRGRDRPRWTVSQQPDGTRIWRHDRSGLSTRTYPGTWRPPDRRPPPPDDEHLAALSGRDSPIVTGTDRAAYRARRVSGPRPGPPPEHAPG